MNTITEAAKKFIATAETWRTDELDVKRRTLADLERQLATAQEKTRTLPVQIGNLRATIARLEAQTAADIAREALETKGGDANATRDARGVRDGESTSSHARSGISPDGLQVMSPSVGEAEGEPYRAGLPPERLRKVWAEWEEKDSGLVDFRGDEYRGTMGDGTRDQRWRPMAELGGFADRNLWALRPHGATWAEVEAKANEAERAVVCAVCRDTHKMERCEKTVNCTACPRPCSACDRAGYCKTTPCDCRCHATPPSPALLDLTKLPPGTVCEATADIVATRTTAAGVRFEILEPDDGSTGSWPAFVEICSGLRAGNQTWFPALVPARVVKEGGEQ